MGVDSSSAPGRSNSQPWRETTKGFFAQPHRRAHFAPEPLEAVGVKEAHVGRRHEGAKKRQRKQIAALFFDRGTIGRREPEKRILIAKTPHGTPPMVSALRLASAIEVKISGSQPERCCWREISRITVSVPPHSSATKRRGTCRIRLGRGADYSWAFKIGRAALLAHGAEAQRRNRLADVFDGRLADKTRV